ASVRITATCTAMGEATGHAAGLCLKQNKKPTEIDVKELQKFIEHNVFW
ncbi:MAG: FAD-dependent oxidoreductase, partial [Candidatus Sericytochromatia bacterium]